MNGDYKGTKLFGVDENGRKYDREARRKKNKIISNVLLVVALLFAIVAAILRGGLSLIASSNPDGLEWSLFGNAVAGYSHKLGLDERRLRYLS